MSTKAQLPLKCACVMCDTVWMQRAESIDKFENMFKLIFKYEKYSNTEYINAIKANWLQAKMNKYFRFSIISNEMYIIFSFSALWLIWQPNFTGSVL